MNHQVSFHATAEQELNDAASYYNALRLGGWCFLGVFATPPNLSRIVRKKPEEYWLYAAGFFEGEAAKVGQGVEII